MPHRILVGLLFMVSTASAAGSDTLFFRGFKGPEYFILSSQCITVKLTDTSLTPDVLAGSYPDLDLTGTLDRMDPHVFVVQVRDLTDMDSLLAQLNSDERVEFAIPGAVTREGQRCILTTASGFSYTPLQLGQQRRLH
jgi:hypothetical protein